jgi:histidine kinase
VPVLDAADRIVQVVSVYRDITELYHLKEDLERRVQDRTDELAQERDRLMLSNQKLEKALEELRNLDQLKGTFVNAISHDLRIPLTGITGYAEFLEDEIGGPLTEQQQVFAREIQLAAARMTRLLNDLLDYARIEAGKITVEPRTIELAELVRGAVAAFRPAAEKKGLRLVLDLQPAIPPVWADPDRVLQILSNLLSNSIKFTPEGGEVRVRVYPEDAMVATEVSDTGPGVPPEVLPHLFEQFFQTEAGIKAGGAGLGLSISKSLVEAQGGTMSVESKPREKTTFRFTLPKAVSE